MLYGLSGAFQDQYHHNNYRNIRDITSAAGLICMRKEPNYTSFRAIPSPEDFHKG